ncbi:MAG TPA: tyrosine-type recombinase/integrase [Caulobacteraceae bacterium]|jgi:integrase
MPRAVSPDRRSLKVQAWPELDQELWARALEPADPLDEEVGYATRWKEVTLRGIEHGYGSWLNWLTLAGELDPDIHPVERATRERVRAYDATLKAQGLADYTRAQRLQGLANSLKAMRPGAAVQWIQLASSRIHGHAKPVRDVIKVLQPVEDVEKLGLDMMYAADHDRFRTDSERAVLYRDGLLIAFLTHRPVRLKNLTAITIGRHLFRRGDEWRLEFTQAETKGGDAIRGPWPACLVEALDHYLKKHRPVLLRGDKSKTPSEGLWIGLGGQPMGRDAIGFQIRGRTEEEFGTPINPHAFRSIAATTIATVEPENVQAASTLLGHHSSRVTEKHYNRAKMIDAGDRYHTVFETERRKPSQRGRGRA